MWQQFVQKKDNWIGGELEDEDDLMSTKIIDINLRANGTDSAFFEIIGEKFTCGFDVRFGGISGNQETKTEWLRFSGYGGHSFRIKK